PELRLQKSSRPDRVDMGKYPLGVLDHRPQPLAPDYVAFTDAGPGNVRAGALGIPFYQPRVPLAQFAAGILGVPADDRRVLAQRRCGSAVRRPPDSCRVRRLGRRTERCAPYVFLDALYRRVREGSAKCRVQSAKCGVRSPESSLSSLQSPLCTQKSLV